LYRYPKRRQLVKTSLKVLWVVAVALAFLRPASAADHPELRLITVIGDAEVKVEPDEVVLTLGVETWNKDLGAAKSANDQRVQKVIGIAGRYQIEKKHIQTDHMTIEPRYENQWEHQSFVGYFVRKTIVITLRDTTKFEDLLSGILVAGANYVHGVQFRTTALREHKDRARTLAIRAAEEKAIDLATELGQKVGKPHTIREDQAGSWSWYNAGWGSAGGRGMAQNVTRAGGGGSGETEASIALGQISVRARVAVSFELE
jgi:uncharacterized protein YggE